MEVREERIERHEKGHAQEKTARGGQPAGNTYLLCLLNGWVKERPHACGNHHARRKAEKDMVHELSLGAEEEHYGRPRRGHEPRKTAAERRPHEGLGDVFNHRASLRPPHAALSLDKMGRKTVVGRFSNTPQVLPIL